MLILLYLCYLLITKNYLLNFLAFCVYLILLYANISHLGDSTMISKITSLFLLSTVLILLGAFNSALAISPYYSEVDIKPLGQCKKLFKRNNLLKAPLLKSTKCRFLVTNRTYNQNYINFPTATVTVNVLASKSPKQIKHTQSKNYAVDSLSFELKITRSIAAGKYYRINGNIATDPFLPEVKDGNCKALREDFYTALDNARSCNNDSDCYDEANNQGAYVGWACNCDLHIPVRLEAATSDIYNILDQGLVNVCDFAYEIADPDKATICLCNQPKIGCKDNICQRLEISIF